MTAGEYLRMLEDRRRYHLRRIIEQSGSQREAAKRSGMDAAQLSNIMAGRLAFTEYRARRIEQFNGLALGSMDLAVADKG